MAGKASFWLDAPKAADAVVSGVPGRVVGAGENGTIRVEVGEPGNVVNVPSGGGVFKPGSDVRVQVDASGAPSGLLDAGSSVVQDGLVYAGAEGQEVRKAGAAAKAAWEKADAAYRELSEARERTAQDLQSMRSTLQGAQGDVQRARLMFSSSEKDPKSHFRDLGVTPPLGAVYEQRGADGLVEYRFRWDGRNWVQFALSSSSIHVESDLWTRMLQVAGDATISGNLLAGGSVTADKVVASKELSAKVAKFEESVVSKLRAQNAVIDGDLVASRLTGKEIVGSTVRAVGVRSMVELSSPLHASPQIRFESGLQAGGGRPSDSEVVLDPNGVRGSFTAAGGRDFTILWNQLLAAPYYRYASGKTRISLRPEVVVRAPLRADTSARGLRLRVSNGTSIIVPESGRYRVTGWGAFWSEKWDATTGVMLLRGSAADASWGDLYGYAIAPANAYSTPSFTGLVDIKAGESVSLGMRANASSTVYDYRFEVEFVCPL